MSYLQAIFAPRAVAVIGATSRAGSVGRAVFENVLRHGYAGVVYPVNPKAASIMSVRAYPTVLDIPDLVDLAIVIVPRDTVPHILAECGEKGVKAAIVITAGFKELGGEGAAHERQVLEAARRGDLRLLGPNCLGVINTDPQVSLNGSFAGVMPLPGNVALVSQSGAVGTAALEYAHGERMGLSKFVSVGNKSDLNENDFLAYLKDDPLTDVILFYLEDLADPSRFFKLAQEVGEKGKKPILAIKSGRTAAGARAASSHTGALAGSDEAYDALFAQCGVLRVESLEELFDYAAAFAWQPLPKGNRVAVVTNAGGLGIMTTDAAERYGLTMASLAEATMGKLAQGLPPAASVRNPVDILGDAKEDRYSLALEAVLNDPGVDGVIVISTPQLMTDLKAVATAVAEIGSRFDKPVLVCQMALENIDAPLAILTQARIPHYHFPEEAARSLAAMARYALSVGGPAYEVKHFADVDKVTVARVLAGARAEKRRQLLEPEAHEIFRAYGFPTLPFRWVKSAGEAAQAAVKLGFPVVLKVVSPDIIHKIDVGGVKVGLHNMEEVVNAYRDVREAVAAAQPRARRAGALVQKMAPPGRETILGMTRDPLFGPLLMFGLGGTYVEIFKDVIFRVAPISEEWACRMIRELKGFPALAGFRGQPPADLEAIAQCLERLSQLVLDFPDFQEMDINPLAVFNEGQGAAVLDARIFLKG
ncbi:MAG: CoA-binding protein [Deltaproteobacteria bacterium]|nr:CoA-binding protein [Deltaproteobacteria bacterium]